MSEAALVLLRTAGSLGVVLAVIWVAAKLLGRASGVRGTGMVEVIARQSLGRTSSVAVVRVADRAFVLGVTEAHVTLLDETDLASVAPPKAPELAGQGVSAGSLSAGSTGSGAPTGALSGSLLSPSTWHRALEVLRDRTARR